MIKKINVTFDNITHIDIDLRKSLLLLGENGVGKTRLLEYLYSLSKGLNPEPSSYGITASSIWSDNKRNYDNNLYTSLRQIHYDIIDLIMIYKIYDLHIINDQRLANIKMELTNILPFDKELFIYNSLGEEVMAIFKTLPEDLSMDKIIPGLEIIYKEYIIAVIDDMNSSITTTSLNDIELKEEILLKLNEISLNLRRKGRRRKSKKINFENYSDLKMEYLSVNRITKNNISSFLIRIEEKSNVLTIQEEIFAIHNGRVVNQIKLNNIIKLLENLNWNIKVANNCFDRLQSGLELVNIKGKFFIRKNGKFLDPAILSSGEKSIVTIITSCVFEENKFLLIDEIDLSLTFDWQIKILTLLEELAQQTNNKYLITTHSALVYKSSRQLLSIEKKQFERINEF